MPKKVYKANALSVSDMRKLADDLRKYADTLPNKCKQLANELAQIGLKAAEARIDDSPLGKYINVKVEGESIPNGFKAVLVATGEIKTSENYPPFNTLFAVEFGAGIRYNPTPNPKSAEMGYGVGTFPGQIHAFDEDGWYFWSEEKQAWIHSYGVKATMPMINADTEIIANVEKIAKEVFA